MMRRPGKHTEIERRRKSERELGRVSAQKLYLHMIVKNAPPKFDFMHGFGKYYP
jgi:hypothetical protein